MHFLALIFQKVVGTNSRIFEYLSDYSIFHPCPILAYSKCPLFAKDNSTITTVRYCTE